MGPSIQNLSVAPSEGHMLGHGFYNKHSHEQGKANRYALPVIVKAINGIDLGQIGSECRIADYGSAQGQNSLLPMKTAIAQIRALAAKSGRATTPISITHTDLPTNDWTTLFQTVLFSSDSYLVGEQDVFVSRAAPLSTSRFFRRTTSRLAIRPSLNIGSAGSGAISPMRFGQFARPA
jgi:hypothetical protein